MKITFLGAAHEVTGSCTYLEVGDKKGLVDYGLEQGRNLFENEPIPVSPEELDFVLHGFPVRTDYAAEEVIWNFAEARA